MVLAGGAMLVLALGYLLVALICGKFRNRKDPAEPKLDGALDKQAQTPGGTGSGIPGRL
jgi:hypothetical protein